MLNHEENWFLDEIQILLKISIIFFQIGEQEESAMKSLVVGPENPITNST